MPDTPHMDEAEAIEIEPEMIVALDELPPSGSAPHEARLFDVPLATKATTPAKHKTVAAVAPSSPK